MSNGHDKTLTELKRLESLGITDEMVGEMLGNIYWSLHEHDEEMLIVLENMIDVDSKYHVLIRKLRLSWHKLKL
jgi:hypothetical protein